MQETMTVSQYVMGLRYQSLHTNIPAQDCNEQHKRIGLITQGGGREENDIHQAQVEQQKIAKEEEEEHRASRRWIDSHTPSCISCGHTGWVTSAALHMAQK